MALHNIKIIVVDGGRAGSYKVRTNGTENKKKEDYKNSRLYKLLNLKETIKNKVQSGTTPESIMALNMGMRIAGQIVKQTANYYISDIGRSTGDSNYQNMITKNLNIASDIAGTFGNALSGAATGSMFGPMGALFGAVIGITSSAVSIGFKNAEIERAYQHEMFKQESSQQYGLARANYSIYTGRKI